VAISVFVAGSCSGDDVMYLYSIAKSRCRHLSHLQPQPPVVDVDVDVDVVVVVDVMVVVVVVLF
jgi:hypothetical protein